MRQAAPDIEGAMILHDGLALAHTRIEESATNLHQDILGLVMRLLNLVTLRRHHRVLTRIILNSYRCRLDTFLL